MNFPDILSSGIAAAIGPYAVIYCLAAIGLNVHFGYTGLLNFGQAAFMMVGAYSLGSLVATWSQSFWVGILGGLFFVVVLALLMGIPTLRLRADYLAIVTIALAEGLRQILGSGDLRDYFNSQDGLFGYQGTWNDLNPYDGTITVIDAGGFSIQWTANDFFVMTVGWILIVLCMLMVWLLMRSPWGRVLKSIREDEEAVRSLGKNVYAYKLQALVLGGIFGGLAGFMNGLQSNASPSDFETDTTFFAYTILLIGGAARVFGPVAGAVIFWFFLQSLDVFFDQAAGDSGFLPNWLMTDDQASLMRFIILGLVLMLLMIFRPQGIFGDRRELAIDAR